MSVKYLIVSLALLSNFSHASMMQQIKGAAVRMPYQLGSLKLLHECDKFLVEDEEGLHQLNSWQLDTMANKLAHSDEALTSFQNVGYFEVKKDSEQNYLIRSHVRGHGGGLITGAFAFSALSVVLPAGFALVNGIVAYKAGQDIGKAVAEGAKEGSKIAAGVGALVAIAPGV